MISSTRFLEVGSQLCIGCTNLSSTTAGDDLDDLDDLSDSVDIDIDIYIDIYI